MNESLTLVLASMAGAALGLIFFGGLWWTVRRGVSSGHPALWFTASSVLRMTVVVVGFYLVGGGRWERLLLCLAGFVLARVIVSFATRPAREVRHATQP